MLGSTHQFSTNDGVQLSYETAGSPGQPVVVLIHGWSGSRRYFQRNVEGLAAKCQVCSLETRGPLQNRKNSMALFHV